MNTVDELMKLADDYRAATRKNDIVGVARDALETRLRELLDVDAISYRLRADLQLANGHANALREQIRQRQEEVEGLRKDAERYAYLRTYATEVWSSVLRENFGAKTISVEFTGSGSDIDTAIDAAIHGEVTK